MGDDKLHFVLLPFMAQGHAIPMIDIAKLLASRSGTTVTLLLTPLNHIRVKPILSRSSQLGAHIHVEELHFPAEEAGLPAGCNLGAMDDEKLHFVVLPFMAQGHAIPMIDIAKLLAARSCCITVMLLLTPLNHIRVKPILSRSSQLGAHIHVEELHFPAEEAGLPAGYENIDLLPSTSLIDKFWFAANMTQPQVETLLKKMMFPKQSCCLVADVAFIFATEVSQKLGIPRIFFNGMNCFASLCIHHIFTSNILDTVSNEFEYFDVPGMPGKISFTGSQVKGIMATPNDKESREAMEKLMRNENSAHMVISIPLRIWSMYTLDIMRT
uniref:Uncharacterized protein n=1 Tax=Kalanchoe fedtschenkoi TaxID=63787 RepID=A0A7N0TA90_KALFE